MWNLFQGKRSQLQWVSHPSLPTTSAMLGDFRFYKTRENNLHWSQTIPGMSEIWI